MKRITAFLFIAFALALSACAPLGAAAATEPSATPGIVAENYPNALPVPSQLALGIVSLKDTPTAVTAQEAATLLPLWQGLLTLANTANSSTVEINAVISQIQDTLTAEQLQAIAAMKLTQADFAKVMQTAGLGAGGATGGTRTGGTGGTTGGTRTGGTGGGPGGDFGGGPGGGFGGVPGAGAAGGTATGQGSISNSTQATVTARQSRQALTGNATMINAVIAFLTQVAGK